jgi:hypothetical protein
MRVDCCGNSHEYLNKFATGCNRFSLLQPHRTAPEHLYGVGARCTPGMTTLAMMCPRRFENLGNSSLACADREERMYTVRAPIEHPRKRIFNLPVDQTPILQFQRVRLGSQHCHRKSNNRSANLLHVVTSSPVYSLYYVAWPRVDY